MILEHLTLRRFRNLTEATLSPHPRFNVLVGANGQGKTNLLEAIYWLATLRPSRAGRLRELVQWGADACRVEGRVLYEGLEHRLSCEVVGGERVAKREGKVVRVPGYFGVLAVVLFTPDDVGLVRGPPADRRGFLDRAIFTGRPAYLADVLTYRRALDARNKLLRDEAPDDLIAVYEATLAPAGARLMAARRDYVEALQPVFTDAFGRIMDAEMAVRLAYRPGADIEGDVATGLCALWAEDRARDRQRGFTQRGPHTDDLVLRLHDRPARAYASQGQQRAMVLALKIGEIELLRARRRCTPVLLLDDVSSELDPERNARLFRFLEDFEGQVFITTTDAAFLRIGAERCTWRVQAGEVEQVEH